MDEFTMQIIFAVAMFLTTAIAGFAPFKLMTMIASDGVMSRKASVIMSIMSCYAGGIFLATCFLDTLPHLKKGIEMLKLSRSIEMKVDEGTKSLREYRAVETKDIEGNGEIVNSDIEIIHRRSRSNSILASGIIHSITFTIAMSFHSILEGIALGVQVIILK
ncbi:unnamed protein product [Acanthocheilonema viteae]|uniref:Uncharacterized protein n=1 Tax=Acanthocheilonema viteae TaxID=6277 RepID=A0A498T0Q7_ACAVI|nr:unnamed protein product [Acanthocheilonema viteae]